MQLRAAFAFLVCLGLAAASARAASIAVSGAAGTTGAAGLSHPPEPAATAGGPGSAGGTADALSDSADSTNTAIANGGNGGQGGTGGAASDPNDLHHAFGTAGGAGGSGGDANATATVVAPSGNALSQANATSGAGGAGGNPGSGTNGPGPGGLGGDAGTASATASATAQSGSSSADARAVGGAGAAGGVGQLPGFPGSPHEVGAGGGAPGEAAATAVSVAAGGDSNAQARAFGGKSNQSAHPDGGTNFYGELSIPNAVNAQGADASAHASAQSDTGDATATAEATGGQAGRADGLGAIGGTGSASAEASSVSGDATAIARGVSGAASPTFQGILVASPLTPGGAGADESLTDAVSGSAGGRLTLIQEATASDSHTLGGGGGNARSELHASNPAGGELSAQVTARGGFGAGDALGIATATGSTSARVEASAVAISGADGTSLMCGINNCGFSFRAGGDATALATAAGQGEVVALARAVSIDAPVQHAASDVGTSGPIAHARSALDVSGPGVGGIYYPIPDVSRSVSAAASIGSSAPTLGIPAERSGETHLFGAPSPADVSTWTAGNPHALDALAEGHALALGAIATGGSLNIGLHYAGSLELDLTASEFDPAEHLALAFLDPAAAGALDLLHLSLTRGGEAVFERSFTDAPSAVAELDDAVFNLGALLAPGDDLTPLVLSFTVDLPMGTASAGSFALDFVLLDTPVPEPSPVALALLSVLALVSLRGGVTLRVSRPPASP